MSALSDLLASKKNEVPKPQPAMPSKEVMTQAANQATGMASTADKTSFMPSAPPAAPVDDYDHEKAADAVMVYASNGRLRRVFLPNGTKFEAINGFFYVKTEEENIVLEQHLARNEVKLVDVELNLKGE